MKINQNFWNKFYNSKNDLKIPKPSNFGIFFYKNFIKRNNEILEIGCGNGRDAFLFSKKTKKIIALDQSKNAIKINLLLSKKFKKKINFLNKDFAKIYKDKRLKFDILYARFFYIQLIKTGKRFIQNYKILQKKNSFLVGLEFRTNKDILIKKENILIKIQDLQITIEDLLMLKVF